MSVDNNKGLFNCPIMCWIIGALLAVATYLVLTGHFGVGAVISAALALGVFVVLGAVLGRLFCGESVDAPRHDHDIAASPKDVIAVNSSGAMAPAAPELASETTSTEAAAQATPKAKVGDKARAKARARATTKSKPKPKLKPKSKSRPRVKTVADPVVTTVEEPAVKAETRPAPKPEAKPAPKPAPEPKPVAAPKPVAKDGKPEMLTEARSGGADDLKQIKGVGPKMQTMLNEMGVYHFDQVSSWRAQEVEWVDGNLKGFKGRVSRDEWVEQAKVLAKGGETEFSKRVEKGGVYNKK